MTDLRTRDEIDPSSRGRRGAHRAAPSRLAALLPVAVVLAVLLLAVLAVFFFTGLGRSPAGGEASASAPATTRTAPPTAAPTTPAAPDAADPDDPDDPADPAPSDDDPADAPGSPAPSDGIDEQGADDGAVPPPGGTGDDPDARGAPVVVLNATRTSGIAASTADELKGQGWTVSRTGDAVKGSVDATRVRYRDPDLESAAQAVAASLGGARVERDAGVEAGVVTVVTGPDRVGR